MKAVQVFETGGIDRLVHQEIPTPEPGPGQARVRIRAIGVNFIDIYYRTGLYKAQPPFIPGMEAAGEVDAVGDQVTQFVRGDRVAYAGVMGSYAEYATVDISKLVRIPDQLDVNSAAAVLLQGMTAHYLAYSTRPVQAGDFVLIHAASGGVGLLLTQIARNIGAKVIGTVSTEQKELLAREAGAKYVIQYDQADFESEVKKITGSRGVDVVYDSVGRTTFERSLNCLRPRGMLVLFGQSSGPVPTFEPGLLAAKGSQYLTRPAFGNYVATRGELLWRATDIFNWISEGTLNVRIDSTYPLAQVAGAHQALEQRKTAGKVLLLP